MGGNEDLSVNRLGDHLEGKTIVKEIYVPGKMVNLIAK